MTLRVLGKAAVFAVLVFMLGGCYKATFTRDVPAEGPRQSTWTHFGLFGLVGTAEIDVREFCADGDVRMIRTGGNVGTDLVGFLTAGLYTPRKVWVQCGATDRVAEPAPINEGAGEGGASEMRVMQGPEAGTWVAYWAEGDGANEEAER